jgi:hypothetical protein
MAKTKPATIHDNLSDAITAEGHEYRIMVKGSHSAVWAAATSPAQAALAYLKHNEIDLERVTDKVRVRALLAENSELKGRAE